MTQIVEKEKASGAKARPGDGMVVVDYGDPYNQPFYVATGILLHLRYVFRPEDELEKPYNFL
jgi:hypothetical protein